MVKKCQRGVRKAVEVIKGTWTSEEDQKLVNYVLAHGDKKWRILPAKAGLKRCGKSCRLRWLNYLRPGIKRGNISEEEEDLIIRLHNLLGNRWSLIAARIPGRTDNEIKNHWNTHLSRRSLTIDDLNNKVYDSPPESINTSNPSTSMPPESNHESSSTNPEDRAKSCDAYDNFELVSSWTELSGLEFDIEQLLDFTPTPDINPGSCSSELEVTDYQHPLHSGVCDINGMGILDSQLKSHLSEFDYLDQLLGCQDPLFNNHS